MLLLKIPFILTCCFEDVILKICMFTRALHSLHPQIQLYFQRVRLRKSQQRRRQRRPAEQRLRLRQRHRSNRNRLHHHNQCPSHPPSRKETMMFSPTPQKGLVNQSSKRRTKSRGHQTNKEAGDLLPTDGHGDRIQYTKWALEQAC